MSAHPTRTFACSQLPAAALLLFTTALTTRAQCPPEWVQRFDVPAARVRPAIAYDANREVVVMLGGDNDVSGDDVVFRQMWEWDGLQWNRRTDVTGGPQGQLDRVEMAYDSSRGVVVLRVRRSQTPPETWEFDGQTWSLRATGGPEGTSASMAFDSRRGVTVLVNSTAGTWEWNGAAWAFRDPGPDPGGGFEIAFDENRGVTVAFGEANNEAQTWEWDGQTWTLVAVGGPPRRVQHAMAYDAMRREVLVHGGHLSGVARDDAWGWDGESWEFITAGNPSARHSHGMAYDAARGRMVLFGGTPDFQRDFSETWAFEEGVWTLADEGEPEARYAFGMTYDLARAETIMFAGSGTSISDTWRHDGLRWHLTSTAGPSRRHWPSMAYDVGRSVAVLFAGAEGNEPADAATWEWDGEAWSLRATSGPPARYLGSMAYDSARQVMLLFGGFAGANAETYFDDTWEWDGGSWTQRLVNGPSARSGSAIAYDEERAVIVLFGGFFKPPQGANVYHDDTWEWDGLAWHLASTGGPTGRLSASMVYDEAARRVVLFGGLDAAGRELDDVWLWDGTAWNELASNGPSGRWAAGAVYVPDRQSVLLFGGRMGLLGLADTWEVSLLPRMLGDLDCDCELSAFDIEPFILALVDPAGYAQRYPNCSRELADINGDGRVDVFDIEPFAQALVP